MIDESQREAIRKALKQGDRIELIPVKNGVKIVKVRRETVKTPDKTE